jgi:hypothetical protein
LKKGEGLGGWYTVGGNQPIQHWHCLGEDTGMLITEGNKMEAIGSGLVVIIDGA